MTQIFKHTNLKLDELTYSKPEKQGNSYYCNIYHGDNKPVYIQTPILSSQLSGKDLRSKKNIGLKVLGEDFGIYDFFLKLDDHNVNHTFKMSKEWFGKELPVNVIDGMYRRGTKPFPKGQNPSLEFKIPFSKDKCECICFDKSKESMEIDDIKEGIGMICIIHIKGLKFLKKEYYCDCFITQIKESEVKVKKSFFDECLIDDDEENIYDEHSLPEEIMDEEDILEAEKLEKERLENERLKKLEKERKDNIRENILLKEKECELLKKSVSNLENEIQSLKKELE